MKFKVKKLSENAIIPTRNDEGAAGYDLYAAETHIVEPGQRQLVKTNIAIHCEKGYFGKIEGRSGLAYKQGICILGGVIDENYSGDIGVILYNSEKDVGMKREDGTYLTNQEWQDEMKKKCLFIQKGDRIAQIIFQKYESPELIEVEELEETVRGEKGYGSSDNPELTNLLKNLGVQASVKNTYEHPRF